MELADLAARPLSYSPVGGTRDGTAPAGFHQMAVRRRIGVGPDDFARAREGLMTWQMHRDAGLEMSVGAPRAAVGVESLGRLGFAGIGLQVPCRVVWVDEQDRHAGFGYGTLPGHPERGEEAFVLDVAPDGTVWLTVRAFSRPAAWYMRAAGPLGRVGQRVFAGRYAAALRRLATDAR